MVLVSQILVLVLGILKSVLIPVVLGIQDFAYWQIYVFYIGYVGLFTLGFNDGLYLRYGGSDYVELRNGRVRAAIRLYIGYLFVVTALMLLVCMLERDSNKRIALYLACLNIVVMGVIAVFSLVLQATGRLQEFGLLNTVDKIVFLLSLLGLFLLGVRSFSYFIVAELASKMIALAFMLLACPGLIIGKGQGRAAAVAEVSDNLGCGIKLMLANLSGMLVLGVGRLVIEYGSTLDNYAFYAFGISMTNLALVALTSISLVVYPVLKRTPRERYLAYYNSANSKLFVFSLFMLGGYFPIVWSVVHMVPKYLPVIPYLNLLFVVTAMQGKMQLLNNNYYKALRLEGAMLRDNLASLALVVIISVVLYGISPSVTSIAVAALLTMTYRTFMSECFLRRAMGSPVAKNILVEIAAYSTFILVTSVFDSSLAFVLYCSLIAIYGFFARSEFSSLLRSIMGEKLR